MHLEAMEERDSDITLEVSAMAASAFRAHSWATKGESAEFEKLGMDAMERWFRYANDFSSNCAMYEGMRGADIAKRFYERYVQNGWAALAPRDQLAFEAVVRHLAILVDAPDLVRNDIESQEQFWRGWTEERLRRLAAPPPEPPPRPAFVPPPEPPPPPRDIVAPPPKTAECHLCGKVFEYTTGNVPKLCGAVCRRRYRKGYRRRPKQGDSECQQQPQPPQPPSSSESAGTT